MRIHHVSALLVSMGLVLPLVSSAASAAIIGNGPYLYTFNSAGVLTEAGSMTDTTSPYWWVNSGAYMPIKDGNGMTSQGSLPVTDPWRVLYATANPTDTDQGAHPQNIFRLVSRAQWLNSREEAYFKINKDNLSSSSNRNQSNGLLLMSRYAMNGQTLYYTGIRVDGMAIIKKKQNGVYTTLASPVIYPGTWNRDTAPNFIPKNTWIGLRSEVTTNSDGSVSIKLYMDQGKTGNWKLIAEAKDTSNPITAAGYGGIRTDFMDVEFDNFRETSL